METHKECIGKYGCGEMLPLEDFHKDKHRKHGRTIRCKKCNNAHEKKYLRDNPEVKAKCYAKHRATAKAWRAANPEKVKANKKAWRAKNPGYITPGMQAGLDMGVIVYCIRNYDNLGNDYVGCTENFPKRMTKHKNGDKALVIPPKLNTKNAEVLHKCGDDRELGDKLEADLHAQGYHGARGDNSWTN